MPTQQRTKTFLNTAILTFLAGLLVLAAPLAAQQSFTLEQVLSAPFPSGLIAAKSLPRFAWVLDEQGKHNIYVAESPEFKPRRLTSYLEEDGQELSGLAFSADGNTIVYTRGGGKNRAGQSPNPTSNPAGAEEAAFKISWSGGEPQKIGAGHDARLSSAGNCVFERDGQLWIAPLGGKEDPVQVAVRGNNSGQRWSPDGSKLAFISARGDHSFVGIYDLATRKVQFVAPTVDSDSDVEWSNDGKQIAFVRQPAVPRDTPEGFFIAPDRPHPWSIWVADSANLNAREIWQSGKELLDSFPYMADDTGGGVIHWGAENRIVFASERDGWQHLYVTAAAGGAPRLLTPGNFEVEQWSMTPDGRAVVFNSNSEDVDRRHLWSVELGGNAPVQWTRGEGIEWGPAFLSDKTLVYLGSDAKRTARVFRSAGTPNAPAQAVGAELQPADFPADKLIVPQQVVFKSADGLEIHGQLFLPRDLRPGEKRPAILFFHGGSMRQMLLGWHYMYYYSNSYGMNQYLASRGYLVLAVNYRSGIGYGRAFREAPARAGRGWDPLESTCRHASLSIL